MTRKYEDCQGYNPAVYSASLKPNRLYRIYWHSKQNGIFWTIKEVLIRLKIIKIPSVVNKNKKTRPKRCNNYSMDLKKGETVEVKTENEIRKIIDSEAKTDGLIFMPEMWKYCGKKYTVYKKPKKIISEATGELLRLRNIVLLDGVICDGSGHYDCERSCFLWWKEAWVKRVNNK